MDRLEENSSNFANDVDKFVSAQKRKMALGCKQSPVLIYLFRVSLTII